MAGSLASVALFALAIHTSNAIRDGAPGQESTASVNASEPEMPFEERPIGDGGYEPGIE